MYFVFKSTTGNHRDQFDHIAIFQNLIFEDHLAVARGNDSTQAGRLSFADEDNSVMPGLTSNSLSRKINLTKLTP